MLKSTRVWDVTLPCMSHVMFNFSTKLTAILTFDTQFNHRWNHKGQEKVVERIDVHDGCKRILFNCGTRFVVNDILPGKLSTVHLPTTQLIKIKATYVLHMKGAMSLRKSLCFLVLSSIGPAVTTNGTFNFCEPNINHHGSIATIILHAPTAPAAMATATMLPA